MVTSAVNGKEKAQCAELFKKQIACQNVCSTRTDVPGYIRLIAQGRFEDAYSLIRETNPFPSICGRVCHHSCESHCRRAEMDAPVAVNALKRFVSDHVIQRGRKIPVVSDPPKNKKIAIVGAGPAGLTAAHDLARSGYTVEMYDKEHAPGGMLAVAIPEYRLPKKTLGFEIDHIRDHGVKIHCGVTVGKDISLADLKAKNDAVLVAVGAHKSGKLGLHGEDTLDGVVDCLDFLKKANRGEKTDIGKSMAVIGGGNTAIDCARMSLRLGAKVTLIYRRTRNEMPALPWEVHEAELEGVNMLFLATPVSIIEAKGQVKGLMCLKMKLGEPDESGRRRPIPVEGSEFLVEVDTLIPAIDMTPDLSWLEKSGLQLRTTKYGTIETKGALHTSLDGVFATGDAVTGPKTVIDAIAGGHAAARAIDRYLQGVQDDPGLEDVVEVVEVEKIEMHPHYDAIERQPMPTLAVKDRLGALHEVELGYTEDMAVNEARRCLQCNHDVLIQDDSCVACGRCSQVCPYGRIRMLTPTGQETQVASPWCEGTVKVKNEALCIRCGLCVEGCPANSMKYRKVTWKRKCIN